MRSYEPPFVPPEFDNLPRVPGQPQGCLWGIFDKPDKKDELGTLNYLTPSVVLEATKEVKFGQHVQLDWALDNLQFPASGRVPFHHHVKEMDAEGFVGLDDEIRHAYGLGWAGLRPQAPQPAAGSGI
ncbi:uncharacterized protein APUU_70163A [Aspergillus puulaauensis]|uniref:Uncharacterized protein n=1 Tax=Aspergillus puulaauensis TaxID=1220207 RepID=A0A7R7XXC3_9EURO|nr:uncharacterized protein APUU_70163A [Aspergillus puulaauensis]BCS28593.1 hypothetical protein APUU_70163A [Aspergillus puulaauensis]